ncbi:MAG: ribosome small subunit-dependent GTPase A [Oscillospiraceae bacterium]|jgi:ribosome biogenesis GTPase|nr:ribosome small subunit-dependent GTPase A [Oscillospiraceae bacterium]
MTADNKKLTGKIIKATGGFFYVFVKADTNTPAVTQNKTGGFSNGMVIECKAKGIFKKSGISPCCGDNVVVAVQESGYCVIEEVLQRKNHLVRPPLANLDLLAVVVSADEPKINYSVLDKLLAVCRSKNIPSVVIITKTDLSQSAAEQAAEIYTKAGISVFSFCREDNSSTEQIKNFLHGKTAAFAGNSGVGKSTLLNALLPGLQLQTGEISKKLGRGRHTTRTVELFDTGYCHIADTPGFSTVDLQRYNISDAADLQYCFEEFEQYLGKCQFTSCTHICEKGCAVLQALADGEITQSRHKSYVDIYGEIKTNKK